MEKAELKWQIEEEAPTIEDLQVRQCSQLPTKHIEEGHMKHVDINCEVDGDLVYALPEELLSGDNGALKFSQEELKEEVDPKCSERCVYYQTDEGNQIITDFYLHIHTLKTLIVPLPPPYDYL